MLTLTHTDEAFFRMFGLPSFAMPFSDPDLMKGFVRRQWPHRILWLGRMVELKQPVHALEILKSVRTRVADAELILLGDGDIETERNISDWLRDNPECGRFVRREGFRKEVRPYLEETGVGLVTSRFEGYCHSIVEIKMAVMPVVAYDMPYLDTLKPESGALVVPQGDIKAAADAIVHLFEDPQELQRQGGLARRSYEELASVNEEERYGRLFRWFESGEGGDAMAIDSRCVRSVAETAVAHLDEALDIMSRLAHEETVRAVRAEWAHDRSYRLGRIVSWPYRMIKRIFRR